MARPAYRACDVHAKDKLVEAFWFELDSKAYTRMSALGVIRAAGLNKNTFYYHFSDLEDLASTALDGLLQTDLVDEILGTAAANGARKPLALEDAERRRRLELLLSGHGSALHPVLVDRITLLWRERLEGVGCVLDERKESLLAFAAGGLVSMFRKGGLDRFDEVAETVATSPVIAALLKELRAGGG